MSRRPSTLYPSFDRESCKWTILGDASEVHRSSARRRIIAILEENEELAVAEIEAANAMPRNLDRLLYSMKKDGQVVSVGRRVYRLAQTDGKIGKMVRRDRETAGNECLDC